MLTTVDVMSRYSCERQTAAAIMKRLPWFKVGKRIFVKAVDLEQWEESKTVYPVAARQHRTQTTKISRRREQ